MAADQLKARMKCALTVDCVIFGYASGVLKLALIKRKKPPFIDQWALPGGFLEGDETCEGAAVRELAEETSLQHVYLEFFDVFIFPPLM